MKKIVMIFAFIATVISVSCKKDINEMNQQEQQLNNLKGSNLPPTSTDFLPKISPENIEVETQKFVNSYLSELKKGGDYQKPIACPRFSKSSSFLISENAGPCIPEVPVTLIYRSNVIELPGGGGAGSLSLDYNFTIFSGTGTPILGTKTLISDEEFCEGQDPEVLVCPRLKKYSVTFVLSANVYNSFGGGDLLTEVAVPCTVIGVTNSATQFVNFYYPQSYYQSNLPQIGIDGFAATPGISDFRVYTICQLLCLNNPFIPCPIQSPFRYRLSNSGNPWLTINIPTFAPTLVPTMGIYEYECTLNYGSYTSLPGTGTFLVN
jgi:hypothetical protein